MAKKLNPDDVARYGAEIASVKAAMPKKRWKRFVKIAHSQGHTVAGQLSGAPDALKARTNKSLRDEAQRTIGAAYKPVMTELSHREETAKILETKRAADDAAYRMWMTGEADKLDAQARAADATLAGQEADIARDLNANQQAAHADSLARVAQVAGGVSDPTQSTALDQTAADTASRERVANQRKLSSDMSKIGGDARTTSRAALIATAAVREATRTAENWKTMAGISSDRTKAVQQQAADAAEMLSHLQEGEVSKAQTNREFALAEGELGAKTASLAAQVKEANRKYQLDTKKFNLSQWTAEHADATAQAKVQLGYDEIAQRDGKAAADRALKKWVEKYKARQKDTRHGVTSEERGIYADARTAQGLLVRMHQRGVPTNQMRARMRNQGVSDPMIDLAEDLRVNHGVPSARGRAIAKRLGIKHVGYFW